MSDRLRVMTFNVRGYHHRDGVNAWPARARLNIETIRAVNADLVGFQETQGGNLRAYHDALPGYHYVAWPWYDNEPPHAFTSIFWRPDRLRPLAADGCWLSETPGAFSGSWNTDNIRCCTWVEFALPSGARVVHLNTHLDHRSALARVEGARQLLGRLDAFQSEGAAAVVTGDFNAPAGSPVHRLFTDADFLDAHTAAGNDDDPARCFTYHGWEGESFRGSDDPPRRIDWILVRPTPRTRVSVRACEIIRTAVPPLYPSDHYPVAAELEIFAR